VSGRRFRQKLGDEYEIRKFNEKSEEIDAIKLFYDWKRHWIIFKAKKFKKKDSKIIKITDCERYEYNSEDLAKKDLLNLLTKNPNPAGRLCIPDRYA
jgi:hypothetical protein